MKKTKILIVDDESYIREFLAQTLSEYYQIAFAKNGTEAFEVAKSYRPSVIVLDNLMPGLGGIEVCKMVRGCPEIASTPIIMLTALNEPEQRINAFNSGADDFLSKPFLPEELIARINRKLEKAPAFSASNTETSIYGDLKLQFDDLRLEIDGVRHDLGQVEYKILNFLLKKRGELVPREELNNYVWGHDLPSERALDPHITSLRKKLQKSKGELKTIYGKGYSFILKDMES